MESLRSLKPHRKPKPLSKTPRLARRYRAGIEQIPTPGLEARRPDQYSTWPLTWKVYALAGLMIVIGVGTEIALALSNKYQGFQVAQKNIFAFTHLQVSFLTSFFPTLFIIPLAIEWTTADYVLRWYQPYVVLSQGNARAEDSLMMDYVINNRVATLWNVTKKRQWIIYFSMITAFATNLYQPLAGAVLSVKSISVQDSSTVQATTELGLIPDFASLNVFLAAAGFTEAAAFQGLPDPPFVSGGWSTAQFTVDMDGMPISASVDTTGIRTKANCASPSTTPTIDTSNPANYTITATLQDGCTSSLSFNPTSAEQQYGTAPASPASCGLAADFPQQFAPVMFWFYHNNTQNQPQASAVICRPTLELFNIVANVNVMNSSLADVTIRNAYTAANNVSGDPLNGRVFNAVLFGDLPGTDKFIAARATAVGSQIPGAIFRFISQDTNTLQQAFNTLDGFLNLTTHVYTQHLAVSAKSVYFVSSDDHLPAVKTSLQERLVVDGFAAHTLAVLLIVIGIVGIAVHVAHARVRRKFHLVAPPGNIASTVALTSHSGFGELLYPFDDTPTMCRKLDRLRFSLDPRTGAIVADEIDTGGDEGDEFAMDSRSLGRSETYRDDASVLTKESSRAPLLSGDSKDESFRGTSPSPPPQSNIPVGLPYEVEPLVYEYPKSGSRSPSLV